MPCSVAPRIEVRGVGFPPVSGVRDANRCSDKAGNGGISQRWLLDSPPASRLPPVDTRPRFRRGQAFRGNDGVCAGRHLPSFPRRPSAPGKVGGAEPAAQAITDAPARATGPSLLRGRRGASRRRPLAFEGTGRAGDSRVSDARAHARRGSPRRRQRGAPFGCAWARAPGKDRPPTDRRRAERGPIRRDPMDRSVTNKEESAVDRGRIAPYARVDQRG